MSTDSKSWASVALTPPAPRESKETPRTTTDAKTCAVLDASAVIGGSIFRDYAEALITTPDVLSEIRDKQSKHTLDTLPFGVSVQDPTEGSVTAGMQQSRNVFSKHALILLVRVACCVQ